VSSFLVDIAYAATVTSTLAGVGMLVGGVIFVVTMVRAFKTHAATSIEGAGESADPMAALYRAVLATSVADAEADSPPVTRPEGIRAKARVLAKRASACDSLGHR
jgi:hypothetical protein